MPRVTIGLPVYNGARSLARAIECLNKQTFTDLEIIVSDNASTDSTAEICRDFAAIDARISCYHQPERLSINENLSFVLEQANTEYFMWAAADDAWEPGFIARLLEATEKDRDVAVSFSDVLVTDQQGAPVSELSLDWLDCTTHQGQIRAYLVADPIMGACNLMYGLFKREILLRGIRQFFWTENGHFGADFSFVLFALLNGRYAHVPATLFRKRAGGASWSIRLELSAWEKLEHVKSMYLDAWRVFAEHDGLSARERVVSGILLFYGLAKVVVARLLPANRFNRAHMLSRQIARAGRLQES